MKLFKKKQLLEPEYSQKKFKKKFPQYSYGKGTYGIPSIYDWKEGSTLSIGSYCSISKNVEIYLGGHHRSDWISTYPFPAFHKLKTEISNYGGTNGDIVIGSDVWICANVTILSGITIGDGAVIANGAVVTRNVSPYEIVGGNPAKHIRYRFDKDVRDSLLKIRWWEWDEIEIINNSHILCSQDIQDLIAYSKTRL